jgi:hypothetical protein
MSRLRENWRGPCLPFLPKDPSVSAISADSPGSRRAGPHAQVVSPRSMFDPTGPHGYQPPPMRTLLCLLFLSAAACSHVKVSAPPASLPEPARGTAISLGGSVDQVVEGGSNLGRLQAVEDRARALGLGEQLRTEWIDWLSFQRNVVIELPGETDELVYFTAHVDKTDLNPRRVAAAGVRHQHRLGRHHLLGRLRLRHQPPHPDRSDPPDRLAERRPAAARRAPDLRRGRLRGLLRHSAAGSPAGGLHGRAPVAPHESIGLAADLDRLVQQHQRPRRAARARTPPRPAGSAPCSACLAVSTVRLVSPAREHRRRSRRGQTMTDNQ